MFALREAARFVFAVARGIARAVHRREAGEIDRRIGREERLAAVLAHEHAVRVEGLGDVV